MKGRDLMIVGGVAAGGYLLYQLFKNKLNPFSNENAAYGVVNAATQAITGDSNDTFGSAIYDFFHDNTYDVKSYKFVNGHAIPDTYTRRSDGQIFKASELSFLAQKNG